MPWQLLITLSVFLNAVSMVMQKVFFRTYSVSPAIFAIMFQFTVAIVIGLFGFLFADMSLPKNLFEIFPFYMLMVLMYALGTYLYSLSLKEIEASRFTVIFASRALFTVLASSLLFKDYLDIKQWVGAALIFFSIALLNLHSLKLTLGRGELLAIGAAILFGISNTNDSYLLKSWNLYPFVFTAFLFPALLLAIANRKEMILISTFFSKSLGLHMLVLSSMYGASAIFFYAALQSAENVSQIAVANLTGVIITVLLSVIYLKEKTQLAQKLFAVCISFLGLMLVSL